MPSKIHGTAGTMQNLTADMNSFAVYVSAPLAVTDPENATGVHIAVTGNIDDESQKNFEVLVQSIGLRAMPVVMNDPLVTVDLALIDAPTLTGEGYLWKFAVEIDGVFTKSVPGQPEDLVGLLVDELNGIVLPSGVVLNTDSGGNIEFERMDTYL